MKKVNSILIGVLNKKPNISSADKKIIDKLAKTKKPSEKEIEKLLELFEKYDKQKIAEKTK